MKRILTIIPIAISFTAFAQERGEIDVWIEANGNQITYPSEIVEYVAEWDYKPPKGEQKDVTATYKWLGYHSIADIKVKAPDNEKKLTIQIKPRGRGNVNNPEDNILNVFPVKATIGCKVTLSNGLADSDSVEVTVLTSDW